MEDLKRKISYVIVVITCTALVCCSKGEDGAIGPTGPAGQDGLDGSDGVDGQNGNANVIASPWFLFDHSEWNFENNGTSGIAVKEVPEMTQEVKNGAAILLYVKVGVGLGGLLRQLPAEIDNVWSHEYEISDLGQIRFFLSRSDNNIITALDTILISYRYIIIPAGVTTTSKSTVDFQKMAYEEVMDHFSLIQ
ncbi:collagen-like protein [Aggregatimonas sangjinii]|uniref:Collagen-like protein n=1 Tax=Aggregatimonas sangjinii TaxID=2583587 RepID=A0A5B7SSS8_9FLAO|nr:collagen-like protein [Aggregatimonas sangjinii]QCX01587.1 collagen-like protein [Aggregatimonas sangjinii]